MQTISVDLPDDLINIFKIRERDFPSIVRETLSIELYREGLISIGKAAEIAGVSIWEMQEIFASGYFRKILWRDNHTRGCLDRSSRKGRGKSSDAWP